MGKKADVEDLKRKTNKTEFKELNDTVSNITNTFSTNIQEINGKMDTNFTNLEMDISENKKLTETKLLNFDEEISRLNNSLGHLEYSFKQKMDKNDGSNDSSKMMAMIKELQNNVDQIIEANANNDNRPIVGATSSGSCFSCGQRINSFPALPSRHRSPDKKNIGGGFTFDHNDTKSPNRNSKFSEKMRSDLAAIANDLSPNKHKFPVERKPVKLPALGKSNTTSQL